jgi:hypothetical protein
VLWPSVHLRPVVNRLLATGFPGHEHESRPGPRIDNDRATGSENSNLRASCQTLVGAETGLAFQHVHEAVEVGRQLAAQSSQQRTPRISIPAIPSLSSYLNSMIRSWRFSKV